jgi:hypothetical protein
MPVGSTSQHSVQDSGFADMGLLTLLCCLYPLPVRQASVLLSASFRFHLTMDTLAVQLTLPLAGCVEDFHPQVTCALPGAPKEKAGGTRSCLSSVDEFRLRGLRPICPQPVGGRTGTAALPLAFVPDHRGSTGPKRFVRTDCGSRPHQDQSSNLED